MPAKITGGKKFAAAVQEIASKLKNASTLEVGFPEGGTYPDGTSIPMVAALNEFGTGRAPPRPFMRNTVAQHSAEWGPGLAKMLKSSGYNAARALGALGEVVKDEIQQSIVTFADPPNAPATIKKKGASKPLVDTGVMLQSVKARVK